MKKVFHLQGGGEHEAVETMVPTLDPQRQETLTNTILRADIDVSSTKNRNRT